MGEKHWGKGRFVRKGEWAAAVTVIERVGANGIVSCASQVKTGQTSDLEIQSVKIFWREKPLHILNVYLPSFWGFEYQTYPLGIHLQQRQRRGHPAIDGQGRVYDPK
ncbi:hypothetical protein TNIN_487771 [Trichonephila inaurata madagascariensis]|uniref:Uncharacterized protein n=1 Tax=Trichonephila inaurata madagascariensis TaxID=2747483 RepID=A0A8X7BU49_9ARAC|nr:hypothetical protein TNIN_487771 [Trichonephila inaurata madagascariensis]